MTNFNGLSSTARSLGTVWTTDPTVNHDTSNGWEQGDFYMNSVTGVMWFCFGNAVGAALWVPLPREGASVIAVLKSANMNSTADQALTLYMPTGVAFRPTKITIKNASISLTTAAGGFYTGAAKSGTALVSSGQAYSSLTTSALALDATLAAATTVLAAGTPLYLSLTTAQGAAATADVYVQLPRLIARTTTLSNSSKTCGARCSNAPASLRTIPS
jgi:hypothetical protein